MQSVLRIANDTLSIEIEQRLIRYFGTFEGYAFKPDDGGMMTYYEDSGHQLTPELWGYAIAYYSQFDENRCLSTVKLPLETFSLATLYRLARAMDFYDSPIFLRLVVKAIVARLLPLNISELIAAHPGMPEIDSEAIVESSALPLSRINRGYAERLIVQDTAMRSNGLNNNIIDLVYAYRPLTEQVVWTGGKHSVFLTSDGLYGCGSNEYNQLALDGTERITMLTHMPIEEVISVACGINHTMMITTKGLFAIGANSVGQLGIGTGFNPKEHVARLVVFESPQVIRKVVCGTYSTMVLTSDGLYAWGQNPYGILGTGDRKLKMVPTRVIMPSSCSLEVLMMSIGNSRTLILTTDGIYHTGLPIRKANTGTEPSLVPIKLDLPTEMGRVLEVGVGTFHCVLLTTTGLYGFSASNNYKELGEPKEPKLWQRLTIDRALVKSIFVKEITTFLLLVDGTVMMAGYSEYANDSMFVVDENKRSSRDFKLLRDLKDVLAISSGSGYHVFFLTKQGVYGLGVNDYGQVGLGYASPMVSKIEKVPITMGHELK